MALRNTKIVSSAISGSAKKIESLLYLHYTKIPSKRNLHTIKRSGIFTICKDVGGKNCIGGSLKELKCDLAVIELGCECPSNFLLKSFSEIRPVFSEKAVILLDPKNPLIFQEEANIPSVHQCPEVTNTIDQLASLLATNGFIVSFLLPNLKGQDS